MNHKTTNQEQGKLALFYSAYCPYCRYVIDTINRLGVAVDILDMQSNDEHYRELINERKRATVPVLKITSANGDLQYMPESADIVAYLQKQFG